MQEVQYCSIKRKLAKGLWYAPGTLLELYGVYILFIAWYCMYIYSCTQEVQDVHYYCSVEVLIKNLILPILLFLVKCTAHFACIIAYFFSLPILLKILLANFVKA